MINKNSLHKIKVFSLILLSVFAFKIQVNGSTLLINNQVTDSSFTSKYLAEFDSVKQFQMKEILIEGNREQNFENATSTKRILEISEIAKSTSTSVGNIISTLPGIILKSYGAEGSLQTISIRGSGSEYVTVFLNGMNISNSLSGAFDFSKFSSEEFSSIEVSAGNDFAVNDFVDVGSIIRLNPFSKNDSSSYKINFLTGSFGLNAINLSTNHSFPSIDIKINLSKKQAKNNFTYEFEGKSYERTNAELEKSHFNVALSNKFFLWGTSINLKTYFSIGEKNLGLPGFISANRHYSSNVKQIEENYFIVTNLELLASNSHLINFVSGLSSERLIIDDPNLTINHYSQNFNSKGSTYSLKLSSIYSLNNFLFNNGIKFSNEELSYNENAESRLWREFKYKRNILGFFSNLSGRVPLNSSFIETLTLNLGGNYSISTGQKSTTEKNDFFNYKIGLGFDLFADQKLKLYSNYGSSIREPNFYEIYFNRLNAPFNKELKNESILNFEAGANLELSDMKFELVYFDRTIKSKIVWYPQRVAIFSPRNIGKIISNGIEVRWYDIKLSELFDAELNYTYTNSVKASKMSESDNTFNKQLIYLPRHKASLIINREFDNFRYSIDVNFYSERFYSEDNDPSYVLPAVILANVSGGYKFQISHLKILLQMGVFNLTNENYFLIQSYPMPGREFRLSINMEIN